MKRLNQTGSHIVALLVGVLVVGVVGAAAYTVSRHQKTTVAPTAGSQTASSNTAPKDINNTASLTQAGNALDSSGGQLDNNLNDSALDNDLNSML